MILNKKKYKTKSNGKNNTGAPSKFDKIDLSKITTITQEGYTDKQLAKLFGVTEQTLTNWKKVYPEFFGSLKAGKIIADAKVEVSLYQRACGYSHPDVHVSAGKFGPEIIPIIKHYPPDPTSMIFWLKNRKPSEWRDRIEHTGAEGKPLSITVKVEK